MQAKMIAQFDASAAKHSKIGALYSDRTNHNNNNKNTKSTNSNNNNSIGSKIRSNNNSSHIERNKSRSRSRKRWRQRTSLISRAFAAQWMLIAFLIYLAKGVLAAPPTTNEAYFNGSAYLRLLTPMPIWDHSAISFRSCRGGEILAQQYNKNSIVISVLNDFLQISLAGPAVAAPNNRIDVKLAYHLLDNRWHTLQFKYENNNLFLYVDRSSTVFANATYNRQFLTNEEIGNEAAVLILGNSFSGCLLDGPGLQFVNASMPVQNVVFGACPLIPGPCGEHDVLIRDTDNFCVNDPCMSHGLCISHGTGYECRCTARYSGKNCEMDNGSPCTKNPCLSGGTCVEDSRGDYQCLCTPNHTGKHCETEVNLDPLCKTNPCRNNGACVVPPGSSRIECDCPKGFAGARCEIDTDDCASQPCLNNGKCKDEVNGFACDCRGTGYNGALCQIDINECDVSPCQHGGQCFNTYGSFICKCPDGWGGGICEKSMSCGTHKCLNGGTCVETTTGFQCICAVGYSGEVCEQSKGCPGCPEDAECIAGKCICKPGSTGYNCEPPPEGSPTSVPLIALSCLNGGKCLNGGTCSLNGTHCYCPSGYSGENCEIIDPCNSNNCQEPMICVQNKCICPENKVCTACSSQPCRNGGICADTIEGDYECKCPSGWTGRNCQKDVDECRMQPKICGNGICKNEQGSYKCYCTPGFTGLHCDSDVDECLSHPCVNGATCHNKINAYECVCPQGYTGLNCEIDINECQSNPCMPGSTCIDMVNNFTCACIPGMTGRFCEINIDDCVSAPCQNNGQCIDGLNSFQCNCTSTGFEGKHCEVNIDECLNNQCTNGAECIDLVNDYKCKCNPGYTGKNCDVDINECESNPCQNNGNCLERSNRTLYSLAKNNVDLPEFFSRPFSYANASGYECVCVPGIIGKNCEININECESNPCSKHGTCNDGVATYTCECDPGFEGTHCELNIDECDRYHPCQFGTCIDLTNDYECDCDDKYGGKNCSVPLIGCKDAPCKNNGQCKPFLVNETEHLFNCTCQYGFQGATCEKVTTFSMVERSLISIKTSREEGYDINLQFKTTIPNGVLAFGTSGSQNEPVSYILELINGRLNLHSSLLNKWEGVFIGSKLNDSKWHKVFVAINTSHLVLSANDEQAIFPVGSYETANNSQPAFPLTFLGGTIPNLKSYLRHLTHQPSSFVGCMQDVVVNGKWVFPDEQGVDNDTTLTNIRSGCPRQEQCNPNPCHSNGECTDRWYKFYCTCQRPHFGHTCEYNITAATFGHENTTHSAVVVETDESARRAIRSILDISMFIRTREPKGHIFYLGSDPRKQPARGITDTGVSYVAAELHGGELLVKMQFNGTPESYTVGGNKLDNGYNHLIEVVRNQTLVQVKLNDTEFFRKTLSSTGLLDAQVLFLGGPPPAINPIGNATSETITPAVEDNSIAKDEDDKRYFKGIIQDVKISNGSRTMIVELYPLNEENLQLPPKFGQVTIDKNSVLKGEVTDDLCRKNPCRHNAECRNTWNDYTCTCPNGYKGKDCQEIEFCQLVTCPGNSKCQNLDDGYECLTNITFRGYEKSPLAFSYFIEQHSSLLEDTAFLLKPKVELAYRTRAGGTLLYIENHESFFEIGVNQGQVTVTWKLGAEQFGETKRFTKDSSDLEWSRIYLRAQNGKLEGGWKGWESMVDPLPNFSADIDQEAFQHLISNAHQVYLGGMPENRLTRGTTSSQQGSQFKGCLGEARVGELLLPYFTNAEMYPQRDNVTVQPQMQFRLNSTKPQEGCVLCFQDDCSNGGVCKAPMEQYACDCLPGYQGDDCSVDIDECLTATCQNNATCIDQIADFYCSCLPGYEGKLCESNIDECASQPCQNGGNCTDLIAAFHCECTDEFAGLQCETLKQVSCENVPCKDGSTCVDAFNPATGNNFTCTCLDGFQGTYCDVPFCKTTPCLNGGLCILADPFTPMCKCSLGFTGRLCEVNIDDCESNPCFNGGQCLDLIGGYACNCTSGFTGLNCEIDIDECTLGLEYCGGLGRCINLPGSFKCICQDSFCGHYCNFTDPCKSGFEMCLNGGTCMEACGSQPDYLCNCTKGYEGKNCTPIVLAAKGGGSSTMDIVIIVVPIVILILIIAVAFLAVFLVMARNKRATRGTYSPSAQEYCNPRLEMDNVLKPPPEERLI